MQLTSEEEQLIVHTLRSKTFSFPLFYATSLIPTCPLFESCSVYVCNTVQLSNTPLNLPALLQFVAMPEMSSSAHYVPHQLSQCRRLYYDIPTSPRLQFLRNDFSTCYTGNYIVHRFHAVGSKDCKCICAISIYSTVVLLLTTVFMLATPCHINLSCPGCGWLWRAENQSGICKN